MQPDQILKDKVFNLSNEKTNHLMALTEWKFIEFVGDEDVKFINKHNKNELILTRYESLFIEDREYNKLCREEDMFVIELFLYNRRNYIYSNDLDSLFNLLNPHIKLKTLRRWKKK